MRFGVHVGNYGPKATAETVIGLGKSADQLGFDSVWVSDHLAIPSQFESTYPYAGLGKVFNPETAETFYEAIVVLSVLAGLTDRVALGTSILVLPQRNPLVVGKQMATLDVLSGGRVRTGVGVGWLAEEFRALGADFSKRWEILGEYVAILKLFWSEREFSYSGSHYEFAPIRSAPTPRGEGGPQVTVGGHSGRALKLGATVGDGIHTFRMTPAQISAARSRMVRYAEEAGRDGGRLRVLMRCDLLPLGGEPERETPWSFGGSPGHMAEAIGRYAEAGVDELLFTPAEGRAQQEAQETMERFASEVSPLFR